MSTPLYNCIYVFLIRVNLSNRTVIDPTSVNRKRNVSTSSVPHQIALDPVQEETSENGHSYEESDDESLGTHNYYY